jgi:ARG/rhodanese/phosphatase superfamily protein
MVLRWTIFAGLLSLYLPSSATAADDSPYRLSDPIVHGNLAIYFVHGPSRSGPVPLTLQEAMERNVVRIRETGEVNELLAENTGEQEVFVQAGELMKGGRQDRVLGVSTLLPPHSGPMPIASLCVERGRWSARGSEDPQIFSRANTLLPSLRAKLEMASADAAAVATRYNAQHGSSPTHSAVSPARSGGNRQAETQRSRHGADFETIATQQRIWHTVTEIQRRLSAILNTTMAAPQSQTSLQLALENRRLEEKQAEYMVAAFQELGERDDDIVGYVFAVNGKLNSADVYPSNGLFRKMWPKLLRASITEAISALDQPNEPAPTAAAATAFINLAASPPPAEKTDDPARADQPASVRALLTETRSADARPDTWVYRNYLAR